MYSIAYILTTSDEVPQAFAEPKHVKRNYIRGFYPLESKTRSEAKEEAEKCQQEICKMHGIEFLHTSFKTFCLVEMPEEDIST